MSTLLNQLQIASPCRAKWDDMTGDDRVRFCTQCQKNVFNISNMDAAEAEGLILQKEGRLCVRMYRRIDGTVLTQDCPVGLAKIKEKGRLMLQIAATFMAGFLGFFMGLFVPHKWTQPFEDRLVQKMTIPCDPYSSSTGNLAIMGEIALPTPAPATPGKNNPQ